jgi:hypothetical protein
MSQLLNFCLSPFFLQPINLIFPHSVLGPDPHLTGAYADGNELMNAGGVIDFTVNHKPASVSNGISNRS